MKQLSLLISIPVLLLVHTRAGAQAPTNVRYSDKHQAYVDSIRQSHYRWIFPAWGKRATKKGFDLPYSAGIMLNPYVASQEVLISDLKVGFNGGEMVPLDFVKFGEVKARVQSITIRPDLWVLPFLDLYAIAGVSYAQTDVNIEAPFHFTTNAKFSGTTFGLGTTFAGGYHGFITIIDINHTWTHMDKIKGAIATTMFTPRIGINILLKNNPAKNIALWVGAPGFFVNRTTEGTINMNELKPASAAKPDLQGITQETSAWYQGLSPAQKAVVKNIAQKIIDKIDGIDVSDATISYSLVKRPVSQWSMCAGAQLQLSHRWQIRTEVGFLGGKQSLLLSGNYRFRW